MPWQSDSLDRPDVIAAVNLGLIVRNGRASFAISKFGRFTAVPTAPGADLWSAGGAYTGFIAAAVAVRVKAGGNVADDVAGTGVRTLEVFGLDENLDRASEVLTTAGVGASAPSTTTFRRVFRVRAITAGSNDNNVGAVDIETTGGVLLARMVADIGSSEMAIYAIPAGYSGWVPDDLFKIEDVQKANLSFLTRSIDLADGAITTEQTYDVVDDILRTQRKGWIRLPEKTDVWMHAIASAGTISVSATISILCIPN